MDDSTRQRLRGGFDAAASQYAGSRPGYPPEAVSWLVPSISCDVLDLAAGSGALTRLLDTGYRRVFAAEPSRNLLKMMRDASPAIPAIQATAERLPFADGSFDVVTVATAFHWFDPDRALPDIARVLRPGGLLSVAWNTRVHDSGFAYRLDALLRSAQPAALQGDWGTGSIRALLGSPLFESAEYAEFPHAQQLGRKGLLDLVRSRSYVIALSAKERDALLDKVDRLFDAAARSGSVEMPYRCQCWRATRLRARRQTG